VYNTFRTAYREAKGWRGDLSPYVAQREFLQPSLNLVYDVPAADGYINLVPDCLATLWGTEKQLGLMDTGLVKAGDRLVAKPEFVDALALYNVRYLITSQPVHDEALALIGVFGPDAHLYENREALPRAFAVPDYTLVQGSGAALGLTQSRAFDPKTTVVLLESAAGGLPGGPNDGHRASEFDATVDVVTYEPTRVTIDVESSGPGWLVLSDTHYPGWEARVDGHPTTIYQANGCVRAVPLETGGRHEIVFQFRPRPFSLGVVISGVSGALLLVAWLVMRVRRDADEGR
jgi:hypothetical protein